MVNAKTTRAAEQEGDNMAISNEGLIVILLVGLIAGWLAGQLVQGTGFGIIGDIIIGIIGAFIGAWLLPNWCRHCQRDRFRHHRGRVAAVRPQTCPKSRPLVARRENAAGTRVSASGPASIVRSWRLDMRVVADSQHFCSGLD